MNPLLPMLLPKLLCALGVAEEEAGLLLLVCVSHSYGRTAAKGDRLWWDVMLKAERAGLRCGFL